MKVSTSQFFKQAVEIISKQHSDVAEQQARLGTGKQLVRPSDDAQKTALIQRLKSGLTVQQNYQSGLEELRTRLISEESILSSAENLLLRIKELAVRGASESMSVGDRKIMAVEVDALRDELMALGNTRDASGNYIFAGSMVGTIPYQKSQNGDIDYFGDDTQTQIYVSDQRTLEMNNPGDMVFQSIVREGNDGRYSGTLSASNEAGLINLSYAQRDFVTRAAELRAYVGEADAAAMVTVTSSQAGLNLSGSLTINGQTIAGGVWASRDALVTKINEQTATTKVVASVDGSGKVILKNSAGNEGEVITLGATGGATSNALGLANGAHNTTQSKLAEQGQAQHNYDEYLVELHSSAYDSEIDWTFFHSVDSEAYNNAYSGVYTPGAPDSKRVNFFGVLGDLVDRLRLSDSPKIEASMEEVEELIQNTALSMAEIGSRMNIIESQEAVMDETRIRFESLISDAEDLDYSTAVTELSAEMLALEAAQSSFAKISQLSLFDYLR